MNLGHPDAQPGDVVSGGTTELNVVTGAFGYTGKSITRRLLLMGKRVRTLTGHPERADAWGDQVEAAPFDFDNPAALIRSLQGATTLYNTYWVRFAHGGVTFEKAVANTKILLRAAEEAGVGKIVHVSVTNPSPDSPLPYFRGKAFVEDAIKESQLSFAIIRPTVIFGLGDILINNIAWLLRRAPFFAIPGSGEYRLQPVFVEDVAELAVNAAHQANNGVLDAAGPQVFTFDELVRLIGRSVQSKAKIVHVWPALAAFLARLLGYGVRDVMLTRGEMDGLMADLLISAAPPACPTRFSMWLEQNAPRVGMEYASELDRHYR